MDPSGSTPQVRSATRNDLPRLDQIERTSFSGDWLTARALRRHLGSPRADCQVVIHNGELIGYALVLYRNDSSAARLYSIAIDPGHRGMRLSRLLIDTCEKRALHRGCETFRLEVREDNMRAINTYTNLGFKAFGRREHYYEDGMAALRMHKHLKHNDHGQAA